MDTPIEQGLVDAAALEVILRQVHRGITFHDAKDRLMIRQFKDIGPPAKAEHLRAQSTELAEDDSSTLEAALSEDSKDLGQGSLTFVKELHGRSARPSPERPAAADDLPASKDELFRPSHQDIVDAGQAAQHEDVAYASFRGQGSSFSRTKSTVRNSPRSPA